jgi:hypothetical protein
MLSARNGYYEGIIAVLGTIASVTLISVLRATTKKPTPMPVPI